MSIFNPFSKKSRKRVFVGKGFQITDRHKENPKDIYTDWDNRLNHTFVFGSTGVGKTRLLEGMVEQDIRRGENVIIIDPKGDTSLLAKVIQLAHETNRMNDFLYLSPIFPEQSISINPLKNYYIKDEIIGHIMSCVECEDNFFYDVALETTTIIVTALLLIRKANNNENDPLTFLEVSHYVSREGLDKILNSHFKTEHQRQKLVKALNKRASEKEINEDIYAKEVTHIANLLLNTTNSPSDYFAKVTNTLRVTLTKMTSGNIGRLIGSEKDNEFISRLENQKGCIFFVQTGSMLTGITSSAISRVTISMVQTLVGRMAGSNKKFDKRLNIYIDEMASAVYMGIETLYAQARSIGVAIIGLTQSYADIIAVLGDDRARKLFDNSSTKIIMRMNDNTSAELVAKLGGTHKVNTTFVNIAGAVTAREVDEDVIKSTDVLRLQKRELFYFGFEGEFKGKTAPVENSKYEIIFPQIVIEE